jgi:hypothetical protein
MMSADSLSSCTNWTAIRLRGPVVVASPNLQRQRRGEVMSSGDLRFLVGSGKAAAAATAAALSSCFTATRRGLAGAGGSAGGPPADCARRETS